MRKRHRKRIEDACAAAVEGFESFDHKGRIDHALSVRC